MLQLLLHPQVPRESKAESTKLWDCEHRNKKQQLREKKKGKKKKKSGNFPFHLTSFFHQILQDAFAASFFPSPFLS